MRTDRLLGAAVAHVKQSGVVESTTLMATVSAANADGTVDVTRNDDVYPRVRVLGGYVPAVGDVVSLTRGQGGWLVLGAHAGADDFVWQIPSLAAGWSNYGGDYRTARYRRVGSYVEMDGLLSASSVSGSVDMFTLPAAFRPDQNVIVPMATQGAAIQCNIYATGAVRAMSLPTGFSEYVSLNCRFSLKG